MKNKVIINYKVHDGRMSHQCTIVDIMGRKVKMVYQAQSGILRPWGEEALDVSVFDGDKWNPLFTMLDMGIRPILYVHIHLSDYEREKRAKALVEIAEEMAEEILTYAK